MIVTEGTKRKITPKEIKKYQTKYRWVITSNYRYENNSHIVEVPKGFLSDGSTFSPDFGSGWIFHDYLYASHNFCDNKECGRIEADQIMIDILKNTKYDGFISTYYAYMFSGLVYAMSYYNLFYSFSDAWNSSGSRGCEFLENME